MTKTVGNVDKTRDPPKSTEDEDDFYFKRKNKGKEEQRKPTRGRPLPPTRIDVPDASLVFTGEA